MRDYKRVCADIDLTAIRDNVKKLMALTPTNTKGLAVIKANAYGHGDVAVAKALTDLVYGYAVATISEAINLRKNGIDKFILILGYVDEDAFEDLVKYDITTTIFDIEAGKKLSDAADKVGKKARCHIKIDTGMNRIGLGANKEGLEIIKELKTFKSLELEGIFTHFFASDEEDKSKAKKQYQLFKDFIDECELAGINFAIKHCANSAAIIELPEFDLDMVRMGIALYGLEPSNDVDISSLGLKQAMELVGHIAMVKEIKKGESIGYGGTFVAKKDMKIATVTVGYGDGYPRRLGNVGQVIIDERRANIVGRVCMDQFMVDVTDFSKLKRGDEVLLTGQRGEEVLSIEEVSNMAGGTFNYEFVCDIGKRVPRRYLIEGSEVACHDNFTDIWDINI